MEDSNIFHISISSEHPGCQIAGYLFLNRAPGNFHIMARSKSHDLEARCVTFILLRITNLIFFHKGGLTSVMKSIN